MSKIVVETNKSCDKNFAEITLYIDADSCYYRYIIGIPGGDRFMKRILVFSDTHNDINLCINIINKIPADMVIHAGDYVRDAEDLKSIFPDKDIRYVKGNGDYFTNAPNKLIVELDGARILVVHGHEQRVKYEPGYNTLISLAEDEECNVVVFGHTHIPDEEYIKGIKVLNPGSAKYGSSYGIIEIEGEDVRICVMNNSW